MACFAPSELVVSSTASAFGLIAEAFIGRRYLAHRGNSSFFPAPGATEDFQDISSGFGNSLLHIAWLAGNNPGLSKSKLLFLSAAGLVKVPDLASETSKLHEFYEIKPNSITGRVDADLKIAALDALYSSVGLSISSGTSWSPNERVILSAGTVLGAKIEISFHFFRDNAGRILYEICIDGELAKLALHILVALLILIILGLIAKGAIRRIPMPLPA